MPSTLFTGILNLCGLSHREAADFLNVRVDTVKSWSSGRNRVAPGALEELWTLADRIERAAVEAERVFRQQWSGRETVIELGIAADDHEAQQLGWPCVGAQRAMAARLWYKLPREVEVVLVPRGSTPATAAAADAHDH